MSEFRLTEFRPNYMMYILPLGGNRNTFISVPKYFLKYSNRTIISLMSAASKQSKGIYSWTPMDILYIQLPSAKFFLCFVSAYHLKINLLKTKRMNIKMTILVKFHTFCLYCSYMPLRYHPQELPSAQLFSLL